MEAIIYEKAISVAPNDGYLHYCLTTLLLQTDPQQALEYAEKAVKLLGRDDNYVYYQLGLAYLAQRKRKQAIQAFALEMMSNPRSVSLINWQNDPVLSSLTEDVARTGAAMYDQVFSNLNLSSPRERCVCQ